MKGSSLFPRVSIFNPKAHLAITSMVKALNVLPNQSTKFKTGALIQKSKTLGCYYSLASIFPSFSTKVVTRSHKLATQSLINTDIYFEIKHIHLKFLFFSQLRITRLILPVVKAGVTDDRMSFHSCPFIILNHLRITFVFTSKVYKTNPT